MTGRTDRTNLIEVVRGPQGLIVIPVGRGIWAGQDLLSPLAAPVSGDAVARLRRGDVVSGSITIPVEQGQLPTAALAAVTVTVSPKTTVFVFPAGATFTNQAVVTLNAVVESDGTPGAGTWQMPFAPPGFSLSNTTGTTTTVRYTGARPTERFDLIVYYTVAGSATATGGGDFASVAAAPGQPPARTDATIATIVRTNLDAFTQTITQLFTGPDLTYQVVPLNPSIVNASLDAQNRAALQPQADGTATINVTATNANGSASYDFEVDIDILAQPAIVWPSANYDVADSRYEFSVGESLLGVSLGVLLPTVSAPSGTVGPVSFVVSSSLAGVVDWSSAGVLSMRPGEANRARILDGELMVNVQGTPTVRAAQFSRAIRVTVTSEAVPVAPNPAFAPVGGLVRTVRVGEFFDIDFTGALTDPTARVVAVSQNTELITVAELANNVVRCTGVAVGSTTYTVSGVWVVRVTVVAATARTLPTTSAWYQQQSDGSFAAITSLALSLEENSARANLLANAGVFLTMTQLAERSITYQERPLLAGLDFTGSSVLRAINLPGGGSVQAVPISLFGDGTDFDFETQSSYAVTLLAEADSEDVGDTTYEAHTASLPLALTITDVFEPTGPPAFAADDVAVNLPAKTDGSTTGFSLGVFDAGQGATYTIDSSLAATFAVDASGELTYIGTAADAVVGNSWTVTITGTNSLGTDTIEILVTVKAVVTLAFSPAAPLWKLPVGQTNVVLGKMTVNSSANDARGLPPVPTLTAGGTDGGDISIRPVAHNEFEVSYTGTATTLTSPDVEFTLDAATSENGLCLPATASIDVSVEAGPVAPVFDDDSYVYELTDGADPPPDVIVGLPTATHAPGQAQRWRIITAQTGTRLFAIDAATGRLSYTGPDAASRATTPSYMLLLGCVNIEGGKESGESTQEATVNVVSPYAPPTENANWNPGANWAKAADGSWHGTVQTGAANAQTIDITAGTAGPYAIQTGLTAEYGWASVPSPPTDFSVAQSGARFTITGTSTGSETLYLTLSDGTTTERLTFHIQVAAATAESSEALWYTDGPGLSYNVIDEKGITIGFPENQSTPVSRNIYCTFSEAGSRTNGSLAEPTQAGFDIVEGGVLRRQITINGTATDVYAYQINIDPTQFDYETQHRYDLTAVMNVPAATVSGTEYAAVHKPIAIHLDVSNVNEPPNRTAVAAPTDFELRQRGPAENIALGGHWVSEDNPDANNLAYRLVQSVVGAQSGQSTTPGDYLTAVLIGSTFQASAGTLATVTPSGVRIKFDVFCREASTGVENSTPMTFYCDAVHNRPLEDSALAWDSGVPTRMEFSEAENVALPHLLRNNIFATSTVVDPSATAGDISYLLREPTFWIVRNTAFQWNGTISLASGGTQDYDMTNAFRIMGPEAAGKDWTLAQSVDDSDVATVAVSGKLATVTAADDLTAAGNTNFYLLGSDGNFVEVYTGYVEVAAAAPASPFSAKTLTATPALVSTRNDNGDALVAGTDYNLTGTGETAADPLTFALNSPSSFPEFDFFLGADVFFQSTRAGATVSLSSVSPTSIGTESPSYFEYPAFFSVVGLGAHATAGSLNVFCIAPQLWVAGEQTSGVTGTLTLTGTDGTDTATKTLYVRVEAM